MTRVKDVLVLFDVDGTLTEARKSIKPEMKEFLKSLREKVYIGVVGGSDFVKVAEQLGDKLVSEFDYVFSENGLVAFKEGVPAESQDIKKFLGEDKLQALVNFVLRYVADLQIPKKRGTFIELRNGMINISPIGRNCSQAEREEFLAYDNVHGIRKTMVEALKAQFPDIGLQYSIGGQISFDVFPVGWDKTYCLNHLANEGFKTIHFFGDKTYPGGNDYEIYTSDKVVGHSVTNPDDTRAQLTELFFKN